MASRCPPKAYLGTKTLFDAVWKISLFGYINTHRGPFTIPYMAAITLAFTSGKQKAAVIQPQTITSHFRGRQAAKRRDKSRSNREKIQLTPTKGRIVPKLAASTPQPSQMAGLANRASHTNKPTNTATAREKLHVPHEGRKAPRWG